MKQYVKSIDSLRILAILGVVLIHTTTRTLEAAKFNLAGYPVSIFLNQIARFAVPLFFIISGFVLELNFDEKAGYLSFIKKRFSRIFIPYVVWSAVYYLFIYNQNHDNFLRVILTGDASYQLYFIPTLCVFYMAFPLLHKIYKYLAMPLILVFLGALQVYLLYYDYFVSELKFPDPVRIAILAYFFFIIGIVAARNKDAINTFVRKWKYVLFPATFLGGIYVFWEGYTRSLATANTFSYYSQWRPSVLIYTTLVGLVFFYLFEKLKLWLPLTQKLSRLSFLVFLLHVIVLEITWSVAGKEVFALMSGSPAGKILFDALFFGITAGIAFLIAFIFHKIPKLYRLTG